MKINLTFKKLPSITLWIIVFICLGIGLYASICQSLNMLTPYGYFLSPEGDDAYDAARVTYPILTGADSLWHILRPFADHRIVTERLIAAFDFIYSDGTEATQGMRYLFFLWLTCLLMVKFIFEITSLSTASKTLLSCIVLNLTFLSIRLPSFIGETVFTWPQVLLYSFCAFLCLAKYTSINNDSKHAYFYLILTSLFVILTLFSFNIGVMLWPIVFVVLYKQNSLRYFKSWLFIAGISYFIYFSSKSHHYWTPGTLGPGVTALIFHPLVYGSYFSRLVSLPLVPSAITHASLITYFLGCTLVVGSLFFLFYFLKKPAWRREDSVLFSCIAFGFVAVILISVGRFWVPSEYEIMGIRFISANLFLWTSLIISTFFVISTAKNKTLTFLIPLVTLGSALWLFFCLLGNATMITGQKVSKLTDLSILLMTFAPDYDRNYYFVALATGVPLDDSLINATGGCTYQNNGKEHLTYLNNVQREYHKSAYSLWPAHIINQKLENLAMKPINSSSDVIQVTNDLRSLHNPAIFIKVSLLKQELPMGNHLWYLLATDNDTIVGFGIRSPVYIDLSDFIFHNSQPTKLIWKGVINSALVKSNKVNLWLANEDDKRYWFIGSLKI